MSHRRPQRLLALLTLGLLVLATTAPAAAYVEQSRIRIKLSGPNSVRCDRTATIDVQVVFRENGRPVRNQAVNWRIVNRQSRADGLNDLTTVTNNRGRTKVRLSFGPSAGRRTIEASATNASNRISVRCAGGLPETAIVTPDGWLAPADPVLLTPAEPLDVEEARVGLPATALRLERLGIDLPIIEGDGVTVPEGAVSHYPDTAWPGDGSNAYFYAHAREGDFLELWRVRTGDRVEVDLADGRTAAYEVSEIVPVAAYDAFEYLEPTSTERVTLQTSLWYEATAPRFIVIAERLPGA